MDIRGDIQQVKDDLAVQSEAAALGTTVLDAYSKAESNAALEAKLASEGKLDGLTAAQREAVIRSQPEYNSTDYGPGSAFWTKGSAAAGLLAGALGGNMQAGAAAGAAPLLASLVKNVEIDAARAALHGIVAAALTQLAGGSGADGMKAGAAGAVTASLLSERLVSALYGKDVSQLTADEKSLVSNLVTFAGAGVGYAAGGGDVSLAACAVGDSYCSKAMSDMAGKNQAALEATGGLLAGIMLPGKRLPNAGTAIVSDRVAFSTKQLDKKFKHASDFGVITTKKNGDTITQYQTAIKSHLDDKATYEHGMYLLPPESKVFFNPQTNNVVAVDKSGNFVSGWKLDPQTKQY
ncbi:colicin D domain-containing protein [Leclercia pneumoniae]